MTRILLVHQPVDGGVGRHVFDLFEGLPGHGYQPLLCGPAVPGGSTLAGESLPPETLAAAAASHTPLPMSRAIAPRADLVTLTRFARIIHSLRPDLVHAHSSKAGAIARLAKLLAPGIPVLYTPHGYAFAGFFEREVERRIYREVERSVSLMTRRVIAVCHAEARLASTVLPQRRVRVVHNGIGPATEGPPDPRIRELAQRGPVICTVTQLRPGKGVETLIDSLPAVVARHPHLQVAIIGDGPLAATLRGRVRDRGLADTVHFFGEHVDPQAALRGADVFVLPSLAESFPYVILEAMSAGIAVASSDVGGIGEAIVDDQNGLLVRPADPAALADALGSLLADEQRRRRLGEAARATVAQRFTRAGMIAGVADVYEEVLSDGRDR